jgi:MSHA pilin protein MshD
MKVKINRKLGGYQCGLTLIELILSMVLISIAVTGVLSVMNLTVKYSADPLIQHQALAIAEAYLEEILLQGYSDPNGSNTGETRATFDNVDDYNGLSDTGAHDQQGTLINNLSTYNVSVDVADQTVSGLVAKRVNVSVSAPGALGINLAGYKFAN